MEIVSPLAQVVGIEITGLAPTIREVIGRITDSGAKGIVARAILEYTVNNMTTLYDWRNQPIVLIGLSDGPGHTDIWQGTESACTG